MPGDAREAEYMSQFAASMGGRMVTGDELKRMKQGPPGGVVPPAQDGEAAGHTVPRSAETAQSAPPAAPEDTKPKLRWCDGCHRAVSKAFVCTQCQRAWYCSKECHRAAWKHHKPVCRPILKPASDEGRRALKVLCSDGEDGVDMDLSSAIACVTACSTAAKATGAADQGTNHDIDAATASLQALAGRLRPGLTADTNGTGAAAVARALCDLRLHVDIISALRALVAASSGGTDAGPSTDGDRSSHHADMRLLPAHAFCVSVLGNACESGTDVASAIVRAGCVPVLSAILVAASRLMRGSLQRAALETRAADVGSAQGADGDLRTCCMVCASVCACLSACVSVGAAPVAALGAAAASLHMLDVPSGGAVVASANILGTVGTAHRDSLQRAALGTGRDVCSKDTRMHLSNAWLQASSLLASSAALCEAAATSKGKSMGHAGNMATADGREPKDALLDALLPAGGAGPVITALAHIDDINEVQLAPAPGGGSGDDGGDASQSPHDSSVGARVGRNCLLVVNHAVQRGAGASFVAAGLTCVLADIVGSGLTGESAGGTADRDDAPTVTGSGKGEHGGNKMREAAGLRHRSGKQKRESATPPPLPPRATLPKRRRWWPTHPLFWPIGVVLRVLAWLALAIAWLTYPWWQAPLRGAAIALYPDALPDDEDDSWATADDIAAAADAACTPATVAAKKEGNADARAGDHKAKAAISHAAAQLAPSALLSQLRRDALDVVHAMLKRGTVSASSAGSKEYKAHAEHLAQHMDAVEKEEASARREGEEQDRRLLVRTVCALMASALPRSTRALESAIDLESKTAKSSGAPAGATPASTGEGARLFSSCYATLEAMGELFAKQRDAAVESVLDEGVLDSLDTLLDAGGDIVATPTEAELRGLGNGASDTPRELCTRASLKLGGLLAHFGKGATARIVSEPAGRSLLAHAAKALLAPSSVAGTATQPRLLLGQRASAVLRQRRSLAVFALSEYCAADTAGVKAVRAAIQAQAEATCAMTEFDTEAKASEQHGIIGAVLLDLALAPVVQPHSEFNAIEALLLDLHRDVPASTERELLVLNDTVRQLRWLTPGAERQHAGELCHVCCTPLGTSDSDNQQLLCVRQCGHVFHHDCAVRMLGARLWAGRSLCCPKCFKGLEPD